MKSPLALYQDCAMTIFILQKQRHVPSKIRLWKIVISVLDVVLWMGPAHLLLRYLLLHSRVGPLAQSLQGPNSDCYTSNCFKYSPNKHMFSYFEPALHTPWYCTPHLLVLDKTNPGAIKDPRLLLRFRAPWPRDSHLGRKTSSRH